MFHLHRLLFISLILRESMNKLSTIVPDLLSIQTICFAKHRKELFVNRMNCLPLNNCYQSKLESKIIL